MFQVSETNIHMTTWGSMHTKLGSLSLHRKNLYESSSDPPKEAISYFRWISGDLGTGRNGAEKYGLERIICRNFASSTSGLVVE